MGKQIIIDGVDVSGCEFYQYQKPEDYEMRYPNSGDCNIGLCAYLFDCQSLLADLEKHCIDNPNCYYKQLKRKEREYEELERQYEILKKDMLECTACRTTSTLKKQLDHLKAENGKLKEHLSFMDCVEARKEEEKQARMYFEKLAQKYKQALDEIENYSARISSLRDVKTVWEDILGIINKAKDGE